MQDNPAAYDFAAIEQRWQKWWQDHDIYKVDIQHDKPKYYVLDMFPYPSGAGLHVGHPLGYIASDIIARYKTLQGYNVLHPMGFDAFGLPAEQYAIQTGKHPAITTAENIKKYKSQLKRIGLSYDWSREIQTCDPSYYHWTQWAFIRLFEHWFDNKQQKARPIDELKTLFAKMGTDLDFATTEQTTKMSAEEWQELPSGEQERILLNYRLAYQEDALVNWCEDLGTVLANDEIQDGLSVRGGHAVTQKKMRQWKLRITAYAERLLCGLDTLHWSEAMKSIQRNWIGKSYGMDILFTLKGSSHSIPIYTTRADTIYGASFLVLAPEHPLVSSITTKEQKHLVETYLKQTQTSTATKAKSSTAPTGVFSGSFAIHPLNKQPLPVWISDYVLMDYGHGAIMAVPADDERDRKFAEHFQLPIIENHTQGTPIESCKNIQEALKTIFDILTQTNHNETQCTKKVNYKIKDAIFARQRYWGEPIPIYFKDHIPYPLPLQELPLVLPDIDSYKPTATGEPPLSRAHNWTSPEGYPLETTTMPGFAGSSAYFLRYTDPSNNTALASPEALAYWKNVDLYIGGSEHATGHLIYARFWHMFLHDIGVAPTKEPFQKMINQGMILGTSQYAHRIKGTQTFVSYDLSHKHSTQKIPIDIRLVNHRGELDIDSFKNWRKEYVEAKFELNDKGQYLCEAIVEKMSKSLFNTVSPDEIIQQYGADTLRLYEMFLGPIEQIKPWSIAKIEGVHRFLKRFWRLFHTNSNANPHPKNLWDLSQEDLTAKEQTLLHKTIYEVTTSTEKYQFNTAISAMMSITNILTKENIRKQKMLEPLVVLLSPYAPHMAEDLYAHLGHTKSIFQGATLPKYDKNLLEENTWNAPVALNGKVKFTISLSTSASKEHIQRLVQQHEKFPHLTKAKTIKTWIIIPKKMVNIVTK